MNARIENSPVGYTLPLFVDTANGFVGIGTVTPDSPLEIVSSGLNTEVMKISAFDGSRLFDFVESSLGNAEWYMRNAADSALIVFRMTQSSYINNSVGMVIGSNSLSASAIFELDSTTKGFLPPVMTTTEKNAISSPATGLVVYDSTLNKLCVYTGAAWQTVTSV